MTKPTTPLLDVLKAARDRMYNVNPFWPEIAPLTAHIAWRESGECKREVSVVIRNIDCGLTLNHERVFCDDEGLPKEMIGHCGCKAEAEAAIKAMEGGND